MSKADRQFAASVGLQEARSSREILHKRIPPDLLSLLFIPLPVVAATKPLQAAKPQMKRLPEGGEPPPSGCTAVHGKQ